MLKSILALCQAGLLVGMTGFAPFVAGSCAIGASGMPAMAMHGGMPMSGHAPATQHAHHGCCGCLGPCAGNGLAALPTPEAAVDVPVPPSALPAPAAAQRPEDAGPRLLPFANGPPSHLG